MPDNVNENMPNAMCIEDWDDAYANAAHIPNSNDYIEQWTGQSLAFRQEQSAAGRPMVRLQYGENDRQQIDVFTPASQPRGIAVFVHGGYWLRFSQSDWSHLAAGPLNNQFITALVGYPLCPEVTISDIALSVTKAIELIAERHPELPIYLAGHSAGGHLVTHLMCKPTGLSQNTQLRIKRVLSISGVHDLIPLTKTMMNERFGLSPANAATLSPARLRPRLTCPVIAWAGAAERPEFIRQNRLLETLWAPLGIDCQTHVQPGKHHFDVIDDLTQSDSSMIARWLSPSG